MKKILMSFLALCTSFLIGFSGTNFVFAEESLNRNYTFDQIYAMDMDEFNDLRDKCNVFGPYHGRLRFYFYDDEKAKSFDISDSFNISDVEGFSEMLGIPSKYIDHINYYELTDPYVGHYDSELNEVEEGIEFYQEFRFFLRSEYSGRDDESQKIMNTIYIMLVLNPDIYAATEDVLCYYDPVYGDIDLNGTVDLVDAILLHKAIAGSFDFYGPASLNADCNGDKIVDSSDAICLFRFLLRLVDSLPEVQK